MKPRRIAGEPYLSKTDFSPFEGRGQQIYIGGNNSPQARARVTQSGGLNGRRSVLWKLPTAPKRLLFAITTSNYYLLKSRDSNGTVTGVTTMIVAFETFCLLSPSKKSVGTLGGITSMPSTNM